VRQLLVTLLLFPATVAPVIAQARYSTDGANIYVNRHDWNGLIAYTTAWARANPNDAMAWYYMGQTYGQLNRPADAATSFERAVSLKPMWPEAWWALAYTDVQLQRYPPALDAVSKAVQQAPDRFNYWNGMAVVYSALNRWDDVVRTLEQEQKLMESAKANEYDWFNLGNGFKNSQRYKQAAAAYQRALRINPSMGLAWNNLGVVEQAIGNYRDALDDYKRAASAGDPLGSGNYTRLQQALAAAPPAAAGTPSGGNTFARTMAMQYALKQQQFHDWAFQHPNAPVQSNPHLY
jgi:tetratricopeptide (TPR) repeat protein